MTGNTSKIDNHRDIDPYDFATILDVIEDESDEMYAFSRFLKNKSASGRTALEKQDYAEMLRILEELNEFMKSIGLELTQLW